MCVQVAAANDASSERLRIIAKAPQQYIVRVQSTDYSVSPDGRVEFKVGGMGGCNVLLFDRIPIRSALSPAKQKVISIMSGTAPVQMLSLHDLETLPRDSEGVPRLAISAVRQKHPQRGRTDLIDRPPGLHHQPI